MSTLPTREDLLKIAQQALFNVEMSRAVNDDRKLQTRRLTKLSELNQDEIGKWWWKNKNGLWDGCPDIDFVKTKAKYQIGDILWLREPAKVIHYFLDSKNDYERTIKYIYLADGKDCNILVPPRFITLVNWEFKNAKWIENCQGVPNGCIKEMARTFLRVTNVRVERLQDIHGGGIEKEGLPEHISKFSDAKEWWINLWDSTAPKGYKYLDNPYCFVYTFEKIDYKDD